MFLLAQCQRIRIINVLTQKIDFFYLNYTYEIALASVIDCDSVIHAIFTVL